MSASRRQEVPAEQTVERELARLVRALEAARQPAGAGGGAAIDRSAYLLLDELSGGLRSMSQLASALHLEQSTASRQVAALVTRGLARRRPDPDGGRAAVIELTPDGRRQLRAEQSLRRARIRGALDGWSDRDRTQLARLLAELNTSIDRRLRTTRVATRSTLSEQEPPTT